MRRERMRRWVGVLAVGLGTILLLEAAVEAAEADRHTSGPAEQGMLYRFNFHKAEGKPYFHPVTVADSGDLTALRPADHPWHRGIWFSWKFINGLNYWEEDPKTGRAQGETELLQLTDHSTQNGPPRFELKLAYHPPGKPAVLTEQRWISVSTPDAARAYRIDWTSTFTAGDADVVLDRTPLPGEPKGVGYGGYAGLSLRLAPELRTWQFLDSEGRGEEKANGQRARWMSFAGAGKDGKPAAIVVFDHPENLGHPTPWYLAKGMPYFSPAVLFSGRHVLPAGKSLTLRYRILLQPGAVHREAVDTEWQAFAKPAPSASSGQIRHRFLASGESRDQLLYVDQADPSKDWTLKVGSKHRDLQLVGGGRLLISVPNGYREYRLSDQKLVKEVKGYAGANSARRLPDGRTVLACNQQGVTVYELSAEDKVLRKATFPAAGTRVLRLTPQGTLLFGSSNRVYEGDWEGKTLRTWTLPQGSWAYQALRMPNGHLLVAAGYNPCLMELDAEGRVLKTIGGKDTADGKSLGYHFFGAFQVLSSGDIVVCNWTGHGADDGRKGAQIVQYNSAGEVVWKWHDPQRAGSINGVIVLDGLDESSLHDDTGWMLGPVK